MSENEFKTDIVYKIAEPESWRNKNGISIKSNLADDDQIECYLSKSLVDYLKKNSAMLKPDELLMQFAEAQKRGIQDNIEQLDDLALSAKNSADRVHDAMLKSSDEHYAKYLELDAKFTDAKNILTNSVKEGKYLVDEQLKQLEKVSDKLKAIDGYELTKLTETLETLIKLSSVDKDLTKLVLNYKKGE
jgi:hypothetical protein